MPALTLGHMFSDLRFIAGEGYNKIYKQSSYHISYNYILYIVNPLLRVEKYSRGVLY
ncbi:hypothetical protein PAJ34TS1_02380 [Paenibacillus azoreducens]